MTHNRVSSLKEMALSVYMKQDSTLQDIAFKALLDHGLHATGASLPENSSAFYKDSVANYLENIIKQKTNEIMPYFLQTVIDDDIPTITMLLTQYPWLLLQDAPKGLVIESKLTWQKFDLEGENILSITAKLKKICMLDKLLPYIKKLDAIDLTKASNALLKWSPYTIGKLNGFCNEKTINGLDDIVIPQLIADCAQHLVDQFIAEPFPYVLPGGAPDILNLSDRSEFAIKRLFDLLCPEKAIKLDNLIDVELLLLAVYKAHVRNFGRYRNMDQQDAFCIRVIGLIQSVLSPETAKMFCENIYKVIMSTIKDPDYNMMPISDLAKQHKLEGGEAFYRSSRGSRLGLGFEFVCGMGGKRATGWPIFSIAPMVITFGLGISRKNNKFLKSMDQLKSWLNQVEDYASLNNRAQFHAKNGL